jgi:hypothetical protein
MIGNQNGYAPEERDQSGVGLGLATLVLGAAIGAAAALLYSSKTAQELRAQIGGIASGWKDQAAELLAQGRERVISAVEQSRSPDPPQSERGHGGQVNVKD